MSASPTRRQKREQERYALKMTKKIRQQTLDEINKQSPEEREKLMLLYKKMLEQKITNKEQIER
jgi:hypothetical protein